ncbi:DUF808 domain-containing protein [Aquabacterium lacunae]|uniref:DUF808 domain-containing protein n=1 Tax=Aquabacterium lacunae TaxID=2528630 RepID=A0A4Q9H577_9BURK|nr:DUF808 domain-containing protein [Aquabacterium lacunae]TBO32427.1 DUF808 domain-containing protein [Aquabacterium lacunae]
MAASSLLALIDDIATVLDDIAVMSKVAAKKTAGVLGDDLALNAEQVAGIRAERELPVVWAVALGSLKNKAILVPAALAISALAPWLITPLLMVGGAFLCFEGFEKLVHPWLHAAEASAHKGEIAEAVKNPQVDMVAFEKDKIQGAVRTDFVLSAEIIAITLGVVQNSPFTQQVSVLVAMALVMTVGVYGFVAAIVKMDDVGLHFARRPGTTLADGLLRRLGVGLVSAAAPLMKLLSVVGMAAMFMVGGGIVVHGIPGSHDVLHAAEHAVSHLTVVGPWLAPLASTLVEAVGGMVVGAVVVGAVTAWQRLRGSH